MPPPLPNPAWLLLPLSLGLVGAGPGRIPLAMDTSVAEHSDLLCSDNVDNDGDGFADCDDVGCQATDVTVCRSSYPLPPTLPLLRSRADVLVELDPIDGERSDELCADGLDNDGDGRSDCADLGCRLGAEVSVCSGGSGVRFAGYASVAHARRLEDTRDSRAEPPNDTNLRVLQLRAFGPVRGIEDSFFVLSLRAERAPRLTFAAVQVPLDRWGHTFTVRSGGGGLSPLLVTSAAKLLLLDPPTYALIAFERSNDAAVELGGPLSASGRVAGRAFAAGGPGSFASSTGAGASPEEAVNSTWAAGAQVITHLVGFSSPYDSQLLYAPARRALTLYLGARFDQRSDERAPTAHLGLLARAGRISVTSDAFAKRDLVLGTDVLAYVCTAAVLAVPRRLLFGAEYGAFLAGATPAARAAAVADLSAARADPHDEARLRAIAHVFVHHGVGVLSLRYTRREVRSGALAADAFRRQELLGAASFHF